MAVFFLDRSGIKPKLNPVRIVLQLCHILYVQPGYIGRGALKELRGSTLSKSPVRRNAFVNFSEYTGYLKSSTPTDAAKWVFAISSICVIESFGGKEVLAHPSLMPAIIIGSANNNRNQPFSVFRHYRTSRNLTTKLNGAAASCCVSLERLTVRFHLFIGLPH